MLITPFATLTYTNAVNQSITLAPFTNFWLIRCDEDVKNQIHSQKQAGAHGQIFTGMSLNERYITLHGEVTQQMDISVANRRLQTVFNPTLPGELRFVNTRLNVNRTIDCRLSDLPKVYWSNKRLNFDINLECTDPFWKGVGITQLIAEIDKRFKFTIAIPHAGMTFGARTPHTFVEFENGGNVEGGFIAVLTARFGTVLNPEIIKITTGEKIRILYNMQRNDIITITNTLQEKRIDINGINGFMYVDAPKTNFFKLDVGTNIIGYDADSNISNLFAHVNYTPNFTHVEV